MLQSGFRYLGVKKQGPEGTVIFTKPLTIKSNMISLSVEECRSMYT